MYNTKQEQINILQSFKDDLQGTDWTIEYECDHGSIYSEHEDHPDDVWYFKIKSKESLFCVYFNTELSDDVNNFIRGIIAQQDVQFQKEQRLARQKLFDECDLNMKNSHQFSRDLEDLMSLKAEAKFTQV